MNRYDVGKGKTRISESVMTRATAREATPKNFDRYSQCCHCGTVNIDDRAVCGARQGHGAPPPGDEPRDCMGTASYLQI